VLGRAGPIRAWHVMARSSSHSPRLLLPLVRRVAWPQHQRQQIRGTPGNLNKAQQVQWREAAAAGGRAGGQELEGAYDREFEGKTA